MSSKILIVNWQDIQNPQGGGAEVHLHEVAKRLVQWGMTCIVYTSHFPGAKVEEEIDGVQIYRVGKRSTFNFTVWWHAKKWIAKHNPDLVLDDTNKIPFFLSWQTRKPVLVRVHHLFQKVIFKQVAWPLAFYVYVLECIGLMSWKKSHVLTVSNSTQLELEKWGIQHISLAHNGIDLKKYVPDSTKKKEETVLYIGRLVRYKGVEQVILAFAHIAREQPHLELKIVGTGDEQRYLESLAQSEGIQDRIRFLGFVSEEKKVELLQEATLLVNASLKEGWGLTTIEANACGTVVVASDVPGLRDSVQDGVTGLLVPSGNKHLFAEKMKRILTDVPYRMQMEQKALEWSQNFTWEKTAQETQHCIQNILQEADAT
jgi:glycosyltransferase involved in cell wall biosynthesis